MPLLLGIDIGTSFVKVAVVDAIDLNTLCVEQVPEKESLIISLKAGWAEQSPDTWWDQVVSAILTAHWSGIYDPHDIVAIGISYQMHGLVLLDTDLRPLRNSIIWCDSRSIPYGENAFNSLGNKFCLEHMLNSPGNFTAAKLAWVKDNEPDIFSKIYKVLLPGDFIAMKLTGEITTSVSALSEGIFYDFQKEEISEDLLHFFGFEKKLFPEVRPVFDTHGVITPTIAKLLHLNPGVKVAYKAGDQLNNALSLNVMKPGEVAATAGTSGVIYAIDDRLSYDKLSRVNSFAHVNYDQANQNIGVLLCINGVGSMNRWVKQFVGADMSYNELNDLAAKVAPGSLGLRVLPFGNGSERMLCNKQIGAQFHNIDVNLHDRSHIIRAVQEGIACSFRYGLDILRENGFSPSKIKVGKANLFLSEVFRQSFADVTGVEVELYESDGSFGAAVGAGIGAKIYGSYSKVLDSFKPVLTTTPTAGVMEEVYHEWLNILDREINLK